MEQLVLLALFLIVAFASSLARWLKARMQSPPPAETRPPDVVVRRPPRLPEKPAMPAGTPPAAYARPPSRPPPVETRRRPPRPRFSGPADLRRAIVSMAVLGPCRALEHEDSAGRR